MSALWYLLAHQWKGAVNNMLRSGLRTLLGLMGFAWIFGHIMMGILTVMRAKSLPFQPVIPLPTFQALLLLMLAFPAYALLMEGFKGGMVTFTAADVDFLFSMPLPQKGVLAFRLALQSLQLLGWITLGTLGIAPYLSQFMGVGLWDLIWRGILAVFLSFLFLLSGAHAVYILYAYRIKASERLNMAVKVLGFAILIGLVLMVGHDAMNGGTPWEQAVRLFNHPVIRVLLFPVAMAVDLIMSSHPIYEDQTLSRILILAGLAAVGVAAMLGQRENVYEPSIGVSLRKSRLREAFRSGGLTAARMEMLREGQWRSSSGGLRAPDLGPGWRALVWKSLQTWLHSPWTSLFVVTFVALGIPLLLDRYLPTEGRIVVVGAPIFVWLYITWMSGIGVFQQARNELAQGDFLKLLPIPPWQVVMAMIAVPVGAYALTLWVSLAAFGLLFQDVPQPLLLPMALIGPMMMATLSLYHTMVAFLFPRKKDPVGQMLAGMLMMPGWGILLFLPITLGGMMLAAMTFTTVRSPYALQAALHQPEMRHVIYSALAITTGTMGAVYAALVSLLLWLSGRAFRAYSPSDE